MSCLNTKDEQFVIEQLSLLSKETLSTEDLAAMKNAIHEEISRMKSKPKGLRSNIWGAIIASVGAIGIAAGVFYAVTDHPKHRQNEIPVSATQGPTVQQNDAGNSDVQNTFSTNPAVLFKDLPFTTHVPEDMVAQRIQQKDGIAIRFYRTRPSSNVPLTKLGYLEIFFPKARLSRQEALNWVKTHSGSKLSPKTTIPQSVRTPFILTYSGYLPSGPYSQTFKSIEIGQYKGQYFFFVSSYPGDGADMMVPYENSILSWWVWKDSGQRLAPWLPKQRGPVHGE